MKMAPILLLVLGAVLLSRPAAAAEVQITAGELRLNGNLVLAQGRNLSDGVVLLVHGTLAHHRMETIANLQGVLTERGFNTLAVTLSLGISDRKGMYDCAQPHRHLHTHAMDEISAWLQWLGGKGAKDVVLLGHSRGGNQVAWFMAERGDPRVTRLVLLAPATWAADRAATSYERRNKQSLSAVLKRAGELMAKGQGAALMDNVGLLNCRAAKATAASFWSYYKPDNRFDSPGLLGHIKTPVLVIAGGKDKVVLGLRERMVGLADGEKTRFALVEDADHFFLDLLAEDVADAIEEFAGPGN
jgi:pimeloyl-ACP methyl ester carboxylesterase